MIYAFDHEDAIIKDFMLGTTAEYSTWDKVQQMDPSHSVVLRGMTKGKIIHQCWKTGREFYYIDTGYIGNLMKRKHYHRVVKNNVQNTQVRDVPDDRYRRFSQRHPETVFNGWKPQGRSILLVTPSEKPCKFYGITRQQWIDETTATLKKFTDRPIIIRDKGLRRERVGSGSLFSQLDADNVYAVVTYQSIAAIESVCHGVPAFATAPTAADYVTLKDLSRIEQAYRPNPDQVRHWLKWLSYCQYTVDELNNGSALKIIQEYNLK